MPSSSSPPEKSEANGFSPGIVDQLGNSLFTERGASSAAPAPEAGERTSHCTPPTPYRRGKHEDRRALALGFLRLTLTLQAARSVRKVRGLTRPKGPAHTLAGPGPASRTAWGIRETHASRRSLAHRGIRASATGDGRRQGSSVHPLSSLFE